MRFLRDNSLTIVLVAATLFCIGGMMLAGFRVYNHELSSHGENAVVFWQYIRSGHFLSALFENWESEFLQMMVYVCLTAFLFQRGSSESKDPDQTPEERLAEENDPPWLRYHGRIVRFTYSYSLGIALGVLFVLSFVLHLYGSLEAANAEAMRHGEPAASLPAYLVDSQFWFESFQNWQSEFLSTAVLVVLSIFLRFRGSPESKPVDASAGETGG
ncbi:MAG: hypothetical protein QHC90_03155 [Shinella sp.]|nr:hypothetical protein [Shinella sp.]